MRWITKVWNSNWDVVIQQDFFWCLSRSTPWNVRQGARRSLKKFGNNKVIIILLKIIVSLMGLGRLAITLVKNIYCDNYHSKIIYFVEIEMFCFWNRNISILPIFVIWKVKVNIFFLDENTSFLLYTFNFMSLCIYISIYIHTVTPSCTLPL